MFILGPKQPYKGNATIMQILVFTSVDTQAMFDAKYAYNLSMSDVKHAADVGIGAAYKLRAIELKKNQWQPIIRCGFNNLLLWGSSNLWHTADMALLECADYFKHSILESLVLSATLNQMKTEEANPANWVTPAVTGVSWLHDKTGKYIGGGGRGTPSLPDEPLFEIVGVPHTDKV